MRLPSGDGIYKQDCALIVGGCVVLAAFVLGAWLVWEILT